MNYWVNQSHFVNLSFKQLLKLINVLKYQLLYKVKVKFVSCLDLKLAKSEISSVNIINFGANEITVEVAANVFAVLGASGILPLHYSDYILAAAREKDVNLFNFINLFYNKSLYLFTKVLKKHSIYFQYDKYVLTQGKKVPSIWLALSSLIGIAPKTLTSTIPNVLVNYAGLLINSSHSSSALKAIISCYLQLDVEIEEFIPEKLKLEDNELSKLGKNNSNLGISFYLGYHIYFNQNKIIIKIYNLDFKTYDNFLTEGTNRKKELMQILNFYLAKHLKYQLIFLVVESEKLTKLSNSNPRKLGVSVWCKT